MQAGRACGILAMLLEMIICRIGEGKEGGADCMYWEILQWEIFVSTPTE